MDEVMTQNMSPELIAQLMELGILPGKIEQSQSDILRGQQMQDRPGPEGSTVRGVYQAANPMQHIGHFMTQYGGRKDEEEARKMAEMLRDKQANARQEFFDAYLRRGGQPDPQQTSSISNMLRNPHAGGY